MRPTGNWRPALLDRDLVFVLVLPPLPRPDMLIVVRILKEEKPINDMQQKLLEQNITQAHLSQP